MSTLAIDFGGTRIKAGIVHEGAVVASFVLHSPPQPSLAGQLLLLKEEYLKLPSDMRSEVRAFVCALPCIVSGDHQSVTRVFGKYDDVLDFPLAEWVHRELGLPVLIENDARAAVIGEWQHGNGRGYDHLIAITLGTGIGSAVISGGVPLHGNLGVAGNLGGHQILHPEGRPCVCGMKGCIEAYVSTWALPKIAMESPLYAQSELAACDVIDYYNVFQKAKAGDALAIELRDRALRYWSVLLVNLIHQYDPEAIILGGGIMAGKDDILPPLTQLLHEQLHTMHRQVQLLSASLGDHAALLGLDFLYQARAC